MKNTMTTTSTTKPKRTNRSPQEIVADLEAKIAAVKQRAAVKEAKQQAEVKSLILAVRALDKAVDASKQAKNERLTSSLEAASATLGTSLVEMGLRMPKRKGRAA